MESRDIGSRAEYPYSALSNFAAHVFVLDGVVCASMEGFLQSLKFADPKVQRQICKLIGREAKFRGKKVEWWQNQLLYWQGQAIDRHSSDYQDLLDRAYQALSQNQFFQKALLATGNATLTHSIGKSEPHQTVLTEEEFVSRLIKIRSELQKEGVKGDTKRG